MKKRLFTMILLAVLLAGCTQYTPPETMPSLPAATEPDTPGLPQSEIRVEPIEGLDPNFIKGVDVSSVLALEKSGVVYYDKNGKEQDIFKTLSDAGVNTIRVRVWNDPFDKNGNGYGGGNCDVANAAEIGRRAAKYGLTLCVDFHYSDFWADPNKQKSPKAWDGFTAAEKALAAADFTKESLAAIRNAGATIGMVQIGNEINGGIAGETAEAGVMDILNAASKAVREFDPSVKIIVHYTDVHKDGLMDYYAGRLKANNLDYDVFGVSYYPFWHGSMDNLTKVLASVSTKYGKETMVLETSYAYTVSDGDGHGNSVGSGDLVDGYPATVQGQADCLRDVMAAAHAAGAAGVFCWEPAWIPVGADRNQNFPLWEQYGSGWASSFSGEYDPEDAGKYYGGSAWDNQGLFDFEGHPLPSLEVFKFVNYGTVTP